MKNISPTNLYNNFDLKHVSLFISAIFLIFSFSGIAQNSAIKGKVLTEDGNLPYANIMVQPINKGIIGDENAQFSIENLSAGQYEIRVSYVGFETQTKIIVLKENEVQVTDIQLTGSVDLEAIVVTGTMKPTFVSDSPIKVDVITAKQLDTYIPAAASSVVEGIQLVNGVQEVVACGVCYTNSISINGLEGAYTAVLMDGTPMYGNLASVYGLNGIPNMIIDRFEVIKGPSSTLYGSEAVAGVINIITKNPEKQALFSVDLMGTTHKESFGNIAFAPKIGKSSGYIGLNYAYINDFEDRNNDFFGDAVLLDRYSLFSKWNFHRKSGKKFTVAAKYYYEDRRNGVEEFVKNRNYRRLRGNDTIYGESIYTNRTEIFGTYEFDTAPKLKLDFSLSNHDQNSFYGNDFYKADQKIAFGNFLWNIEQKKHDVLIGLTARYNAYDDNSVATQKSMPDGEIINQPNNQFIPGVFAQDEFTVSDKWTILTGLRLDHYESHGLIFAPRISTKFKASSWTTFRANFGTGFRVVNLFTEDHAFVSGQRTVEITENLQPEKSYNGTFNLNHVYSFLNGTGTIDLETYFTHFTNKIIPDYDDPSKIVYENSNGFARTLGLGLTITHNFSMPFSFNFGMNFQRATERERDDLGNENVRKIEFAPRWSGVLSANYRWKKQQIVFAYTANFTGIMSLPEVFDIDESGIPFPKPRSLESQPFSLHDLQISKTFNANLSLYFGVQNLFNFVQNTSPLIGYNDPNAPVGFSDFFDTVYAYAPNHGREFYLGIKWDLKR